MKRQLSVFSSGYPANKLTRKDTSFIRLYHFSRENAVISVLYLSNVGAMLAKT